MVQDAVIEHGRKRLKSSPGRLPLAGTIKPSALLAQPLPHADVFSWSNSRCGSLRHEEPKVVEEWDCMPDGEPLPEVIKGFVDGSNDLFLQGSFPVRWVVAEAAA